MPDGHESILEYTKVSQASSSQKGSAFFALEHSIAAPIPHGINITFCTITS